jgi:hypothetical protein
LLEAYSIMSMDLAMSRAFCGTPSALAPGQRDHGGRDHPELRDVPAKQIAAERAGSLQRFCGDLATEPRINNENSLMWLDSWL